MFNYKRIPETPKEDEDTFVKRIRRVITDHTNQTSGIRVFEHEDESNLDDYEQKVLENLRNAHEEWTKNNPKSTATDRDCHGVNIKRGLTVRDFSRE